MRPSPTPTPRPGQTATTVETRGPPDMDAQQAGAAGSTQPIPLVRPVDGGSHAALLTHAAAAQAVDERGPLGVPAATAGDDRCGHHERGRIGPCELVVVRVLRSLHTARGGSAHQQQACAHENNMTLHRASAQDRNIATAKKLSRHVVASSGRRLQHSCSPSSCCADAVAWWSGTWRRECGRARTGSAVAAALPSLSASVAPARSGLLGVTDP